MNAVLRKPITPLVKDVQRPYRLVVSRGSKHVIYCFSDICARANARNQFERFGWKCEVVLMPIYS